jgi:hypothetical protein
VSDSPEHGVGVPEHVPVPLFHVHPLAGRHEALDMLDVQGFEVPPQVPLPFSQLQPLAERQVVGEVLVEHGTGVPLQTAVEDQLHPLAERHVVLMVFEAHVVGVPEQTPEPGFQVQPLNDPPLYVHVVLVVLIEQAAGVPVHMAGVQAHMLFSHVD